MKKKTQFLLIASLVLFLSSSAFGQFRMAVGPALGMNLNLHGGSDIEEGGSGFGIAFSGLVDMTFNKDKSLGILVGLDFYDNRSGSSDQLVPYNGVNYSVENDVSIAYFQIESLFKYRIPAGLYFVFGPVIGFDMTAELEQTISVVGGQGSQKSKQSLKDTKARFELKAGAGFDIPISKFITLAPQLTFGFGLTDVIKDVSYNIHTFQAAVICKFNVID